MIRKTISSVTRVNSFPTSCGYAWRDDKPWSYCWSKSMSWARYLADINGNNSTRSHLWSRSWSNSFSEFAWERWTVSHKATAKVFHART
jgi:hypothetical protein